VFLPYLAGERAPVWNSDVRGAFHGIERASDADDFLWAVMEGVAMAVRDIVRRAQAARARARPSCACRAAARSRRPGVE
jgi:xylulokinase